MEENESKPAEIEAPSEEVVKEEPKPKKEMKINTIEDLALHEFNHVDGHNISKSYEAQLEKMKNRVVKKGSVDPRDLEPEAGRGSAMFTTPEFDKHEMYKEEDKHRKYVAKKGNIEIYVNEKVKK